MKQIPTDFKSDSRSVGSMLFGGYRAFVLFVTCFFAAMPLLNSCQNVINTTDTTFFDEFGKCKEKNQVLTEAQPKEVKFFVEVSGSMNGFFRSGQATGFKHDVWSVVTDFVDTDGSVNVYTTQGADAEELPVNVFRDGMNRGAFVSSSSTNVPDMISRMLDTVSVKDSEVGVLISDLKYDPVGNAAKNVLLDQYSTDVRNIMMRHPGVAVGLIAAKSAYLNKDCEVVTDSSPYYYLVVGKQENVVFMRNFISTLLKHNGSFVDEMEWGIDYLSPSIAVTDCDYLTKIDENKSYGSFEDECTLQLSIDITNYPWLFENKDSLAKYLTVKSNEGTEAQFDFKKIGYEITYDDGKSLKRTAHVKVPLVISNMYEESDIFEISLKCPEVQMPNEAFCRFLNSNDVNEVTTTFSMINLLRGFYSSMQRFKESNPVHILISKNQ